MGTPDATLAQVDAFAQFAADHEVDQLLTVVARHRLDTHQAPVAQHGDALRDLGQFFEAMGNVDDRHAAFAQAQDLREQHVDLARGEHRGGFVEDQHPAVADQVAGDLDHLLMTDAQVAHQGVRVDGVEAHLGHGLAGLLTQAPTIDPATATGQIVKEQVFRHGQRRQQVEFLHDHAHPATLGGGTAAGQPGLALELHLAGGWRFQAADYLRQGALARAVLAGQGQHFAAVQLKVDVPQHGLGIGLADATDRQYNIGCHRVLQTRLPTAGRGNAQACRETLCIKAW